MASGDMALLLQRAASGNKEADSDLLARVYRELHTMAKSALRGERPEHTLQATALVHEAFLSMMQSSEIGWKNPSEEELSSARLVNASKYSGATETANPNDSRRSSRPRQWLEKLTHMYAHETLGGRPPQ
jgi:hypothetical protein